MHPPLKELSEGAAPADIDVTKTGKHGCPVVLVSKDFTATVLACLDEDPNPLRNYAEVLAASVEESMVLLNANFFFYIVLRS